MLDEERKKEKSEGRSSEMFVLYLGYGLSRAVATLYVSAQGVEVVESGKRRWVDTHWFRGNSYFRIGWDWVKAALINGWKLIHDVRFTRNQDPSPAMASLKQHQQRLYRLEFKIQTYTYAVS